MQVRRELPIRSRPTRVAQSEEAETSQSTRTTYGLPAVPLTNAIANPPGLSDPASMANHDDQLPELRTGKR